MRGLLTSVAGWQAKQEPYSITPMGVETVIATQASYTISGLDFGEPNSTREIFAVIVCNVPGARTFGNITIGGVTASKGSETSSTQSRIGIAFATVPSGTSGSIVVNISGGSANDCTIYWFRVVSRPGRGNSHTDFDDDSGSSTSANMTGLTYTEGSFILAGGVIGASASDGSINASGSNVAFLGFVEASGSRHISFASSGLQTSGATGNVTFSWSGSTAYRMAAWVFG